MRKYYIHYPRNFANEYSLRWAETKKQENYLLERGYERITFKTARDKIVGEEWRQKYNPSMSGYGDDHIYPFDWDDYDDDLEIFSDRYYVSRHIVTRI